MEVLLSKLSYRLYELESYSLSYDLSPVESLIDIREGLDWLSVNASKQLELMSLDELLSSYLRLVISLQQAFSPFNFKFRDLLLEFIDLARQLILEQDFYLSYEPNLAIKTHQISLMFNKVEQLNGKLEANSNLEMNVYESQVDQDNDYWLDDLIDFIERFSRVGVYYFEGGLNFKQEEVLNNDAKLALSGASTSLVLGVKTSQSLAWMTHNFTKFAWGIKQNAAVVSSLNLTPLFRGLRHANELLDWREKKRFKYSNYYKDLEKFYISSQSLTLKQAAEQLSNVLKALVETKENQNDLCISLNAFSKLQQSLPPVIKAISSSDSPKCYLSVNDYSGSTLLSLKVEESSFECEYTGDANALGGGYLSVSTDLDVLEHPVWQMKFANETICVPDHKIHSIQIYDVIDLGSCDNFSFVEMTFENIGVVDVFIAPKNIGLSELDARVVLIEGVEHIYGILVTDLELKRHAYKVLSKGVDAKTNMLWCVDGTNVVPEINPCAYDENGVNLVLRQDDVDIKGGGWLALINGIRCFIHADIVEKHLPVLFENVINLPGSTLPLVKLEGVCYPYLELEKRAVSSLVLLAWQDKSICVCVSSIYYEADTRELLQEVEGIKRAYFAEFALTSPNYDANLLYVIDSNSFG